MCSDFLKRMDNYQGDLADIIRATGSSMPSGSNPSSAPDPEWQVPGNPVVGYYTVPSDQEFGDPFNILRDPLLQDIDTPVGPGFFDTVSARGVEDGAGNSGGFARTPVDGVGINGSQLSQKILDDEMKRPSNIFSRMLQISPNAKLPLSPCDSQAMVAAAGASPRGLKVPPMLVSNDHHALISPNSSKGCLMESPAGLQISSPRNTGIKRRKSQAKKVVCIPAPAPANSRATGEVVPSDLWAWRKYGQKPIKGSPYPRGYYRCSSSKGCSARKQVERSRTDPNMLVITYTSEHNHPWPTQRNALAGSTRSQPTKTSTASKTSPTSQQEKSTNEQAPNETRKENTVPPLSTESPVLVKQEMDQDIDDQKMEMDDHTEFNEGFPLSYKPTMPDSGNPEDSFFADLGEIETDPLHLIFAQGFSSEDARDSKSLDPFSFYDWAGSNNNAAASTTISGGTTSFGEAKGSSS